MSRIGSVRVLFGQGGGHAEIVILGRMCLLLLC